jgi:hypothetical protein
MRYLKHALLFAASTIALDAHAAITKTELAGNPLSQYPYFEYVRAFDNHMSIRIAIDPGRFPSIVGKTCDIFVVKHKNTAGWAGDPALIDLTPGGALPRTFVAGSIQANTVSVVPTLSLDDAAGVNDRGFSECRTGDKQHEESEQAGEHRRIPHSMRGSCGSARGPDKRKARSGRGCSGLRLPLAGKVLGGDARGISARHLRRWHFLNDYQKKS